jgi:hypothetical protein
VIHSARAAVVLARLVDQKLFSQRAHELRTVGRSIGKKRESPVCLIPDWP